MTVSAPRGPLTPPGEQFWKRYSPHYEFPLSSLGSLAMHVAFVAAFVGLLWLLARFTISEKTPVPMHAMTVVGTNTDEGPLAQQVDALPERKEAVSLETRREVAAEWHDSLPPVRDLDPGLRPEDLPSIIRAANLSDELRKALAGAKQVVPGTGKAGAGKVGPSSSTSRACRWELVFNTKDGKDYVAQLAVMKAALLMTRDGKAFSVYKDLSHPKAEAFRREELPELHFIDDDAESVGKVAKVLGLDYAPKSFIAFFPKDIEEELAAKEKAFRNRKESEIFSTKFRILIRDGKPSITVIDQVPVKR